MLSKQQRNGRESRKQQEMSDEVKVGKRLRSLDLQGEREERERERRKAMFVMQGHVDRGVDTRWKLQTFQSSESNDTRQKHSSRPQLDQTNRYNHVLDFGLYLWRYCRRLRCLWCTWSEEEDLRSVQDRRLEHCSSLPGKILTTFPSI